MFSLAKNSLSVNLFHSAKMGRMPHLGKGLMITEREC